MRETITEDTSLGIAINRRKIPEKVAFVDDQRRSSAETRGAIVDLNNIAQERCLRKYTVRDEQRKKLVAREKAEMSTSKANDKLQLYHPLGGSELCNVTYRAGRCEKSAGEKLTKQPETRMDDREAAEPAECERGIGTAQRDSQIITRGEKSMAMYTGNTEKFKRYDRSDKTSDENIETLKAPDLKGRGEKDRGWKRKRWTKRRYGKYKKIRKWRYNIKNQRLDRNLVTQ